MRGFSVVGVMLLVGVMACVSHSQVDPALASSDDVQAKLFQEGQIIDVESGRPMAFHGLLDQLADQDVIYLGEEHHHQDHIRNGGKVLQALLGRGRKPALAIEMFAWDGQKGLNDYLSNSDVSREQFLEEARWKQNWGGEFKDYEPLIQYAREHQLPVLAMNPPRRLVQKVAQQGLATAVNDPAMARWGMQNEPIVDDPAYKERIMGQLRQCHGGLSDASYDRIYEASMFRDEGMAKTIVSLLESRENGQGPIVSYTGGGHIQYKLPVPNRVLRRRERSVRQTTIYMASLEPKHPEYIEELIRERIADYVWVTPMSEHGPPRRCG